MNSPHRLILLLLAIVAALRAVAGSVERTQDSLRIDSSEEKRVAVLRQVADLFELNLVVPYALPNEKIDLKLQDASWQQAFEKCLSGTGYVFLARGNVIWVVQEQSRDSLAEYYQLRDRLDRATEETDELRGIVALLIRPEAPPMTKEQRAQIQAFLDDPASPASALRQKLGPDATNVVAAAGRPDHLRDTLSIDFPNEPTSVVLSNVAELFELKLTIPPGFPDTKLSIKLRDVTWRQIFEMSLRWAGYLYRSRGDSVWLVPVDEQLGPFGHLRALSDREEAEVETMRQVLGFLVRPDAPALTAGQRARIQALLDDPKSSAADLRQELGLESAKPAAAAAK